MNLLSKGRTLLTWLTVATALSLLAPAHAFPQEKQKIFFKSQPANSKYLQQHVIDAGDVPGHQIRIIELRRVYPTDPPAYDGVRLVEELSWGYSDWTNGSGHAWGYIVRIFENGDKIFARYDGAVLTTVAADGSRKTTYSGTTTHTGGTGKFRGIRGMERVTAGLNPQTGFNENVNEGEYWIEK
jgi:hypothetical protein